MLRRPRRAAARPLVASVAALVVLSGCAATADPGDDAGPSPSTQTSATPSGGSSGSTASPAADETPKVYVAMGDSYTAAPLDPLDADLLIDDCLRSPKNYPTLVAEQLGITVTDVSCSGASTTQIFGAQQFTAKTEPPQIDALPKDADLVTVGIGANDFTFFSQMIFDCLEVADRDVEGAPCQEANADSAGRDRLRANLSKIRTNVKRVVKAIKERAPQARVLLIGYPQIIPSEGTCRPRLPLAVGDYAYTLDLNLRLVRAVRRGGVLGGAEYVDLKAASEGHDVCADVPWVAGIRGKDNFAAGLHPYPAEQKAVADLVLDKL